MKTLNSIKWKRFWMLISLWESEKRKWKIYEKCKCDCWNEKWILRCSLFGWRTKSCWCMFKEMRSCWKFWLKHGMSKSPIYHLYISARDRCNNKKCKKYEYYGGRWIKFLWDSFESFYNDMWESYDNHVIEYWRKQTTLDRIDVNWHYCKENCRWATHKEQVQNTRVMFRKNEYDKLIAYLKSKGISIPEDL